MWLYQPKWHRKKQKKIAFAQILSRLWQNHWTKPRSIDLGQNKTQTTTCRHRICNPMRYTVDMSPAIVNLETDGHAIAPIIIRRSHKAKQSKGDKQRSRSSAGRPWRTVDMDYEIFNIFTEGSTQKSSSVDYVMLLPSSLDGEAHKTSAIRQRLEPSHHPAESDIPSPFPFPSTFSASWSSAPSAPHCSTLSAGLF